MEHIRLMLETCVAALEKFMHLQQGDLHFPLAIKHFPLLLILTFLPPQEILIPVAKGGDPASILFLISPDISDVQPGLRLLMLKGWV